MEISQSELEGRRRRVCKRRRGMKIVEEAKVAENEGNDFRATPFISIESKSVFHCIKGAGVKGVARRL